MIDEYGVVGTVRIGRGKRSTRREPAPMPLWRPKIPYDSAWDRTRAAAAGGRRLTAWAIVRPSCFLPSFVSPFASSVLTSSFFVRSILITAHEIGGLVSLILHHYFVACVAVARQRSWDGRLYETRYEQRLGKHVPAATVTHATGETGCCLRGPRRGVIKKRIGATSQLSSAREAEKR
jgi:hypothetical protein